MRRLITVACEPVDAASVGAFRVAFGVIMVAEVSRFFMHGWIGDHYLTPAFLFKYYGFEWVIPWPGAALYWHFGALLMLATMVVLGVLYRAAIVGLFFLFAYVFLLEQASYLNQYYLLLSVALLLSFIPADHAYSIRALRKGKTIAPVVPRWSVWALRLLFELMLVHAGLVKINEDWLVGQPLGLWFAEYATTVPIVGPWLNAPGVNIAAAYGVVLLHIVGAPLLLWHRTRFAVFILYVGFHLTNSLLFHIGLFPWLTLAGTLMFFSPDWPRHIARRLSAEGPSEVSRYRVVPPAFGTSFSVFAFLAIFFLSQLLVPLRYLWYPGKVAWTNEGQSFAWRMKLNDRQATAHFIVTDPLSGRRWEVDPSDHLRPRQVLAMSANPDMVLQFVHHLEKLWIRREGVSDVEIRALVTCSLNGRPPALLIDPQRDLTTVARTWRHYDWILPLTTHRATSSFARQ